MFATDADALFAVVLARPADDLVRLIFADALEESGHPAAAARAAYIRASVELLRCEDPAERARLGRFARAARAGFADEVDAALADAGPSGVVQVVHARGFAESLHCHETHLADAARLLSPLAPWRLVWLDSTGGDPPPGWLDSLARFGQLQELVFTWVEPESAVPPAGHLEANPRLRELLEYPAAESLPQLTRLGFVRMGLADGDLVRVVSLLARTGWAERLTGLDLRDNRLGDRAAALLASARGLRGDLALDLAGNRFSVSGRELLARKFGGRVRF